MKLRADLILLALAAQCIAGAAERLALPGGMPRAHDPSTIVRCKEEYWCFATGPGIRAWHSRDLQHWEAGPVVFRQPPAWVSDAVPGNHGFFWAPDVIWAPPQTNRGGGRHLLYYSASTWGKNTSAIGLASNATLDPNAPEYAWKDEGIVVQSRRGDHFNAIDPSVFRQDNGRLWLAFGSFWSGIKVVELDGETGKRLADAPLHAVAHSDAIEAPCLAVHDGFFYLFVNWGQCCRGTNSTYNIRVGRSRSVIGPYLDRKGVDLLHGGGTLLAGRANALIGPGHAGILGEGGTNWLSCHVYYGPQNSDARLELLRLRWKDGWPDVTEAK